ncbi:MAG TPA: sigma-54 dependent transcriptional regulator [Nitrospirota bacterium]|nr:sigma-54 dependent transcriptional regulator [Nitrospirota bacterium]
MKPRVLLVDDESAARFGFVKYLSKAGYEITEAEDIAGARNCLAAQNFEALILDLNLPDGSGFEVLDTVRSVSPGLPVIVVTGAGDIPLAVEAMRRGADNFLTKPVDMASLEVFLKKTVEIGSLKKISASRQRLAKKEAIYFGESPAMQAILDLARIAAESDTPLLISGETGTGKGMIAKWIHGQSKRSKSEFVDVNCSALRGELLARELFGNLRGAFTSADQDRQGLLDIADKGTLFLDEIGEMDTGLQASFLKILEEKKYRRLGDVKTRASDFRLISATNKNLSAEIEAGGFRQDLFFRINLLTIHLPPLRERLSDLAGLIRHLLVDLGAGEAKLADDTAAFLETYSWPGNIRELRNVLERALLLARGSVLAPEHFSGLQSAVQARSNHEPDTLEAIEDAHIQAALRKFDNDVTKAAAHLKISRATLYRKIKQLNLKQGI